MGHLSYGGRRPHVHACMRVVKATGKPRQCGTTFSITLLVDTYMHPFFSLHIDMEGVPFSTTEIPKKIRLILLISLSLSPSFERTPLVWNLHWVGDYFTIRTPLCCSNRDLNPSSFRCLPGSE